MPKNQKAKKTKAVEAKTERTRVIPVKPREEAHYELHIAPAQAPHEVLHVISGNRPARGEKPASAPSVSTPKSVKISVKIWRILEWFATSALIFMVLFFAVNFSSYFDLFKNKLDSLRGEYKLSPYIEQLLTSSQQTQTQELLPVSKTVEQDKTQIPTLSLEVAPPDDRIIIPRINKNVPIVQVKTENLVKRDWNALEKDIQEALQGGVVHYPGTAEPGDHGNVVITGHSSYFLWDPGRFKDVFALLHQVVVGDTVIVFHNQEKYTYKVYQTEVVTPDKVDILTQGGSDMLTLITCTPVGTNLKRLIVLAKPV